MKLCNVFKIICVITFIIPHAYSMQWLKDTRDFMRGGIKNFGAVGTVFPLSRYMAAAMIKSIEQTTTTRSISDKPVRIIEVGAGNGALTEYLIKWVEKQKQQNGKEYLLDLVELEPDFCKVLKEKFKAYDTWVHVHCIDICKFKIEEPYDILISTLPFNSKVFSPELVESILKSFEDMLKPMGLMMYVEYAACGSINKTLFLNKEHKQAYESKRALLHTFKAKHPTASRIVFRNVPPTYLYTIRVSK